MGEAGGRKKRGKRMNNSELFERACRILPGGVDSPVRAFRAVGGTPFFTVRGEGAYLVDEEENRYLDYVMSWSPLIFGHAREEIVRAVTDAAKKGLTFGTPTGAEAELAEEIADAAPFMEMVRLVNSGTEATMSAVRVARGFTRRDKIVKFAGNYHGHSDGLLVRAGSGCLTGAVPDSLGVPASYAENTLVAQYNDLAGVQELFDANRGGIACVIVEPVAANMGVVPPEEGFLQGLRKICDREGALLIFDEVITGFRVARGGAAQRYGVTPDLAAYGKIVGGGMPLAAYGGRRDAMSLVAPLGGIYQAGTLSGNPVATAAGLATLRLLREEQDRVYPALEQKGAALEAAFVRAGVPVGRVGSVLTPFFTDRAPKNYTDALACDTRMYAAYFRGMLAAGIYVAPSQFEAMFLSAAHSAQDIGRTASAIASACRRAKAGI